MAAGLEPGDRVGDLGAEHRRVGDRRARRARRRRRARAAQHAVQGRRGGVRARPERRTLLFTVTGFLGTDYVAMLREAGSAAAALEHIVVLQGDAPGGTRRLGRLPRPRRRASTPEADAPRADAVGPTTSPTSSSRRAPPGSPRARCRRTAQTLRAFDAWADAVGLRAGDRYLVVNPFFHSFGLQGRHRRLPHQGRDDRARSRCSTSPRCCARVAERAHLDAARARRRSTSRSSTIPTVDDVRPVVAAARGHGRRAGPGRADPAHARRARASRPSSPATASPRRPASLTMCRHDDDPETISHTSGRAIPDVEVRDRRRRRRRGAARRAGRGRRAAATT